MEVEAAQGWVPSECVDSAESTECNSLKMGFGMSLMGLKDNNKMI